MIYNSKSERDTIEFAQKFAKTVKKGTIILLEGDLGAGKTHFVKGFAKGLKCKDMVTSPTFTIMNIYDGGKMPIYHFDMYRLSTPDEAEELGFGEQLSHTSLDGVTLVEWGSNVEEMMNEWDYKIIIKKGENDNERSIEIERRQTC